MITGQALTVSSSLNTCCPEIRVRTHGQNNVKDDVRVAGTDACMNSDGRVELKSTIGDLRSSAAAIAPRAWASISHN